MKTTTFERGSFWFAVLLVVAFFFLPLFLIHRYQTGVIEGVPEGAGEATVGIAVILRATARRLLRAGSSNILRTTLGAYMRAAARAATRRVARFAGRIIFGSVTSKVIREAVVEEDSDGTEPPIKKVDNLIAVLVGFGGLILSFWGILLITRSVGGEAVTTSKGLSFLLASLLAGVPMLVYALLNLLGAKLCDVRIRFRTAVDGLILQGYFTGAGSFLPMTTDVEYHGTTRRNAGVAAISLAGMYLIHLGLQFAAGQTDSYVVSFLSTMFLIYCFVYSFPIKPLEGQNLWAASKLLWLLFWIPILFSFVRSLPPDFAAIL